MKKNDIIKVNVRRQIITPETVENYPALNLVPRQNVTLDVVVDSVGTSIIKGHYLNENDKKYYEAFEHWDMDGILGILEYVVVKVEIDKYGSVYEYKVFASEEADYYECEKLREEAKKAHLKKGSDEWWSFMGRAFLTTAHPSEYAWTTGKKADGVLVD